MKGKNLPNMFVIPTLPTSVYKWLKAFKDSHGIGYWEAVIIAIRALPYTIKEHPDLVEQLVADFKGYSSPYKHKPQGGAN